MTGMPRNWVAAMLIALSCIACSDGGPAPQVDEEQASPADEESATPSPEATLEATLPPYVAAEISVGAGPGYLATGSGSIWTGNHVGQTISRIDPRTNKVSATIELNGEPTSMTTGFGRVWTHIVLTGHQLIGIDPERNEVAVRVAYKGEGGAINGITMGAGSVWFAPSNGTVMRVDPVSGKVLATVAVGRKALGAVTFGAGALWYTDQTKYLSRIDPNTNEVQRFVVGRGASNPVFGLGAVWVPNPSTGEIARFSPLTGKVTGKVQVGSSVDQLRVSGNDLWVRLSSTELIRMNVRTMKVMKRYELPPAPIPGGGLTLGFGAMWIANFAENTVWRIE
ncbi:MAG: hypothetical protein ACR2LG_00820 [Actinomycetota bacterium]